MKKKHYFSRGAMLVLCLIFAVLFLLPTVLTITNSFMSQSEINSNYGVVFNAAAGTGKPGFRVIAAGPDIGCGLARTNKDYFLLNTAGQYNKCVKGQASRIPFRLPVFK